MTAPLAPPPNRLQWVALASLPVVFAGIVVGQFGATGRLIATWIFAFATAMLLGAMIIGFYLNVFLPRWRGDGDTDS